MQCPTQQYQSTSLLVPVRLKEYHSSILLHNLHHDQQQGHPKLKHTKAIISKPMKLKQRMKTCLKQSESKISSRACELKKLEKCTMNIHIISDI
jgi:hypothetical protein